MKKNKIFLLEDNPIHSGVICDGLEDIGFTVKRAQNVEEAFEVLDKFEPDIFILDIVIENSKDGGILFADEIHKKPKFKDTPVLFISAHLDELNIEKHFPGNLKENVLPKPFDFEQLVNKTKEILK